MIPQLQFRRLFVTAVLLCLAFAALGYRLVDLQLLRHEEWSALSQQRTQREFLLEPRRGDILDIKGNPLATSHVLNTICADPVLIGTRQAEVARALAPVLQLDESKVVQALTPQARPSSEGGATTNRYVVLKHRVPVETWAKVSSVMSNLDLRVNEKLLSQSQRSALRDLRQKAIFKRDDQVRQYPNQALAAHVLGFTSAEERLVNDTPVKELKGREGIEFTFDSKLAGVRGWRRTETDRQRRELVRWREQDVEPRDGLNVVLTLDSMIQHIVESELATALAKHTPQSVSCIVIRPRTGEILAMATLPNFDPNDPGAKSADARRNRVITDVAEPGSTFKIVVVSSALSDGLVRLSDTFDCEHGHWVYGGRPLRDHEAYGVLSVERIITKSSNIGAAKIGVKMGEVRLMEHIQDYGFGTRTGIPLPGEVVGLVRPLKSWRKVSLAQIPMGQGIAVTRLQMVMAMCAIANQGWLMRPMLVDRLEDSEHNVVARYAPQRIRQVISESAAQSMVTALKTVVSPEGTAPKAALEHYTVAGKTGTAQKAEHGVYVPGKYFSTFIGFFPAEHPELCISVTLDEPQQGHYGGAIAGPIFAEIAERTANYLSICPDIDDTSLTNATEGVATAIKTAATRKP